MMFVRTQFSVSVCGFTRESGIHRSRKKNGFQQKSGIHRSCVGTRNGLLVMILNGLKFACMLRKVKSAFIV